MGGVTGKNIEEPDYEEFEISPSAHSFKDIVMAQLHKINQLSNVEFRGGFYTIFITKTGEEKEIYVQDTREAYSNAVFQFSMLMQPKYDEEMHKKFKLFEDKLKLLEVDFLEISTVDDEVVLGEIYYTTKEDKVALETYKVKKLRLYQRLFLHLSRLLAKQNYMEFLGKTYE